MTGILKDWGDASYQVFFIGLSALVFSVVAKLLVARYEHLVPQPIKDVIAIA